jgi:hypothetical protein
VYLVTLVMGQNTLRTSRESPSFFRLPPARANAKRVAANDRAFTKWPVVTPKSSFSLLISPEQTPSPHPPPHLHLHKKKTSFAGRLFLIRLRYILETGPTPTALRLLANPLDKT